MSKWMSDWMNEWKDEWMEWINERVIKWRDIHVHVVKCKNLFSVQIACNIFLVETQIFFYLLKVEYEND